MSKSGFLEKLLEGATVEWKMLGEVGNFVRGSGIQKSDFTESGTGCIHYGQFIRTTVHGLIKPSHSLTMSLLHDCGKRILVT